MRFFIIIVIFKSHVTQLYWLNLFKENITAEVLPSRNSFVCETWKLFLSGQTFWLKIWDLQYDKMSAELACISTVEKLQRCHLQLWFIQCWLFVGLFYLFLFLFLFHV